MKANFLNKKYLSKSIAALAAAAMLTSGAAMAAERVEPFTSVFDNSDGVVMVPLRANAEKLGYTVEWNEEGQKVTVSKGAQSAVFAIGKDSYAFSKAMPVELGHEPVLFNGDTTYVPLALFTDVLNVNAKTEGEEITFSEPNFVTIDEITEDGAFIVTDEVYGKVVVQIDENTEITANGAAIDSELIEVGMLADVEYNGIMTRSIPPQTTAVSIDVQNFPVEIEEQTPVTAKVLEVNKEEGVITVSEIDGNNDEVIVFVTETTIIKNEAGELLDITAIEKDSEISVVYSDAMTMSIPPQTSAVEITVK